MVQGSAENTVILAGATGKLGSSIARYLRQRGATVKALIRPETEKQKVEALQQLGVLTVAVDFGNADDLTNACRDGSVLVSALSGLREVIVEAQTKLLEAAVAAGVPLFIPSDYPIDFFKLPPGTNRNLDLRREFAERLDRAPIQATSILNGMFTDLLTGEAPLILFPFRRVIYWGKADQPMDFTTRDNTAAYIAAAALDPDTPRFLRIAGDVQSVRGLKVAASQASGKKFRLLRLGGLRTLGFLIKFTRTVFPQKGEVFPAWQGMQYLHNMLSGLPKLQPLDNNRYPEIKWTSVEELLATRKFKSNLSPQ